MQLNKSYNVLCNGITNGMMKSTKICWEQGPPTCSPFQNWFTNESFVHIRDGLCKGRLQIPPWCPSHWGLQGGGPHMSRVRSRCRGQGHRCWLGMEVCLHSRDDPMRKLILTLQLQLGRSRTRRTGQGLAAQRTGDITTTRRRRPTRKTKTTRDLMITVPIVPFYLSK